MKDRLAHKAASFTRSPMFKKSKAFFKMGIKQDVPKVKAFKASEPLTGTSLRAIREQAWSIKDRLWGKKSLMPSQVFATGGRATVKSWRGLRIPIAGRIFWNETCAAWSF
jgi:hypothetical protein